MEFPKGFHIPKGIKICHSEFPGEYESVISVLQNDGPRQNFIFPRELRIP